MYDMETRLRIYTYKDLEKMFDFELDILEALGEAAKVVFEREGEMNEESYAPEVEKRFNAIIAKYEGNDADEKVMDAFSEIMVSKTERLNQMVEKYGNLDIAKMFG